LIQQLKELEEMKASIHRVREALSPSDEELISEIRALEYLMFMAGEKQVE